MNLHQTIEVTLGSDYLSFKRKKFCDFCYSWCDELETLILRFHHCYRMSLMNNVTKLRYC